jgi:putative cardiolipin synthase
VLFRFSLSSLPCVALGAIACALALSACTYVPFDTDRAVERAIPPGDTTISRTLAKVVDTNRENSIVMAPLIDGNDALGARLRMIERAERSIDIKTFLIKPDTAGSLIWLALYGAAERGVKIRLLYDDVFTSADDSQIATLDAHPNVDIRAFNPLSRNSITAMNFVLDFKRVNRRMHNKAMIVDGALAVIGGRNLADEYYQIKTSNEFADFDLLVAGGQVARLSDAFDLYWNDDWSVPISNLVEGDDSHLRQALAQLQNEAESEEAQIYQQAKEAQYLTDLVEGRVPSFHGTARVVVDDPAKLRAPPGQGPFIIGDSFYNMLLRAQSDVLVITPYFVPEPYGADVFEALAARGVRVRIATNSLAATNHAYVHGGYAKYRARLLEKGVEFLEVRADAPSLVVGSDTPLVLHSKLAFVDDRWMFVGSTNVDPRSIRQNTEIGMVIDSPSLTRTILRNVNVNMHDYAFKVRLGPDGDPVWLYEGRTGTEEFTSEPGASAWSKLVARIAGWLPIEQQL